MRQDLQNTSEDPLSTVNAQWFSRPNENKNHKKNKTGPCRRWGHSTAIADSRLFIYGGTGYTTNARYWENIYQLDLENWDWTKLEANNKAPSSRDSHSCIVHKNKLYIFGGSSGNDSKNDMYEYDLTGNLWKKLDVKGDIPSPREGHAACLLDEQYMVIYGGWNGEETFDSCYLFDIPQKTWLLVERMLGLKPTPRESQSCCMVRRDMYFFGGQGNSIVKNGENLDNFYNDLHRLRIRFDDESKLHATATWDLIQPIGVKPSKRSSHSSCAYKNRYVFIVGGEGYPAGIDEERHPVEYRRVKKEENSEEYPCFPKNDVWYYDVQTNLWGRLKIRNEADFVPRFAHSNVIFKDNLVVFGGLHDYHNSTNDIHVLALDGSMSVVAQQQQQTQRIQPRGARPFMDDGMQDEENTYQSQSERSSVMHDESDYPKEKASMPRNFDQLTTSRKESAFEQKEEMPEKSVPLQQQKSQKVQFPSSYEISPLENLTISTNFLCSLSFTLSWPLAAFGLLLDNSLIVGANNFSINYLTKQRRRNIKDIIDGTNNGSNNASVNASYLVLEDNGSGWGPEDFIKILTTYDTDQVEATEEAEKPSVKAGEEEEEKIFNSEEEEEEKQKEIKKEKEAYRKRLNEYAFNFKVGSVRLGKNIILISRNGDEVSFGFLSADRRYNPNLHRSHAFYYSWKKSNGEYLTKRAEKNRNIIWNALAGMFSVDDLMHDIDKIGNRVVIFDLNPVQSVGGNNQAKPDLELLSIKKDEPENISDIMVRTLDRNLRVFYNRPSVSLVELSLRTYLTHFFLDPTGVDMKLSLNGIPIQSVNVKESVEGRATQAKFVKVGEEDVFEGVIFDQEKGLTESKNLRSAIDLLGKDTYNQGVLIYHNNRLIRRLENSKMGNLDFLSSQYNSFIERKEQSGEAPFFERTGYIQLSSDIVPNAFKTEISNPIYSNCLQGIVMSQVRETQSLNNKRVLVTKEVKEVKQVKEVEEGELEEGEIEGDEVQKKVKTNPE